MSSSPDEEKALDPEAARVLSKVRRLMAISVLFTGLAIVAVLLVVGYRIYRTEEARPTVADAVARLPAGARVTATTVSDGRIVITADIGGATELHIFDLHTLALRGRLRIAAGP